MRSACVTGLLAGALTMALPGLAVAGPPGPTPNQAYWDGDVLRYIGGVYQANTVVVTKSTKTTYDIDDTSTITASSGCAHLPGKDGQVHDLTLVRCSIPAGATILWLAVLLGDSNDTIDVNAAVNSYTNVYGGSGNDTIRLGTQTSATGLLYVYGEAGNDTIQNNGTSTTTVVGGTGADTMCAISGGNTYVSYADHSQAVTVSVGGPAGGDGASGEGDTVCSTVKGIHGGTGADSLTAASTGSFLGGGPGNDQLVGGAGNDTLRGEAGIDVLNGGAGDDLLDGRPGPDVLDGGAGIDTCRYDTGSGVNNCEL